MKTMKYAVLLALVITAAAACGKMGPDTDEGDTIDYYNALVIKTAGSTKSTVIPMLTGVAGMGYNRKNNYYEHVCYFFREEKTDAPRTLLVDIKGVTNEYVEKTSDMTSVIENILINGLDGSLGLGSKIDIKMNQGKYEGDNELIEDVQVKSYRFAIEPLKDDTIRDGQRCNVEIVITTKAGDVITILAKESYYVVG